MTLSPSIGWARSCLLGMLAIAGVACEPKVIVPLRPAAVPVTAAWAGYVDGGAWIDCALIPPERYRCVIFNDRGEVWASGEFIPQGTLAIGNILIYKSFDGRSISLANGGELVPDGWVDFPISDQEWKRMRFERGREISEEIQHGSADGNLDRGNPIRLPLPR